MYMFVWDDKVSTMINHRYNIYKKKRAKGPSKVEESSMCIYNRIFIDTSSLRWKDAASRQRRGGGRGRWKLPFSTVSCSWGNRKYGTNTVFLSIGQAVFPSTRAARLLPYRTLMLTTRRGMESGERVRGGKEDEAEGSLKGARSFSIYIHIYHIL